MDAKEIGHCIALLFNPMPDMSGNNINRLHGEQRRRVERLAAEIATDSARMAELEAENARLREEWAQEGIGWLRDKDIDRLMGFEAENERLRAAVDMARSRLTAIRNGEAFQPHLHAAAGLDEINDLLASA